MSSRHSPPAVPKMPPCFAGGSFPDRVERAGQQRIACRPRTKRQVVQRSGETWRESLRRQTNASSIALGVGTQGSLWTIERVPEVVDGGVVRGMSDEHHVSMTPDGRTWIRKRVLTTGHNPLTAEAVCWLIACEMQMDVPAAAVYVCERDENETSWLSQEISPTLHWDETEHAQVVNLENLGGLIALDVLTLNNDRHAGNLIVQPDDRGSTLTLWGIDSGNALIGQADDFVERRDETPNATVLPVRALVNTDAWDRVRERALQTAEQILQLNSILLDDFVTEACLLGREPKRIEISQALLHRRDRIVDLTARYLQELARTER
jgi:hypothetical protein